jgi:ankyrin repeat protein
MGADVNVRNDAGQTPLMFATEKGYADMVQVLIQSGANPKLVNNQGESALTIALMKGYTRIAESLELAEASHKYERGEEQAKL